MAEATVLDKIVADKRITLEQLKKDRPLASFAAAVTPSERDFYTAMRATKPAFILECKKASPSKGLIREPFDVDEIAQAYRPFANAISVLTDTKYFQGSMAYLQQVRDQVAQPVLCKDFIVDEYQIMLARYHGADAILLMLSVLDDETYQRLADCAHRLGMGILTETSNEHEAARANRLGAQVLGINNRQLRDLTIDLGRTERLAPLLPKNAVLVSESGIYYHSQLRHLRQFADAFLVGSALMSQPDLHRAASDLIYGQHKVCGLTRPEDAEAAYLAGAHYGGLIFAEQSPRAVTPQQAATIMASAPLAYVGVFVDEDPNTVASVVRELRLSGVQLHGAETPDYVRQLRELVPENTAIWKAHGIADQVPDIGQWPVDRHVLDCRVGQRSGGTGQTFDWSLLANVDRQNVMLAGGLNPDNAAEAAALGCAGLDFNSGVESAPGKKDITKLQAAFAALREY